MFFFNVSPKKNTGKYVLTLKNGGFIFTGLKPKTKPTIMKSLKLLLVLMPFYCFSQEGKDTINVYIDSKIDFSTSANDNRSESNAGTGNLGIKFKHEFLYGSVHFTVYSQNKSITTTDSSEVKLFGTNLLLPENNSGNISNFRFAIGTRSFSKIDTYDPDDISFFHWKKIGANLFYGLNNTTWSKDSISMPVFINNFSINITYDLLHMRLYGEKKDLISFRLHAGYTSRRIGGDYGLDKNEPFRESMLTTSKLGFNGFQYGARLEVGEFFAQANVTSFPRKYNIDGFSGDQAVISFGIVADINVAARHVAKK
jgi:hypothetical protein